MSDLCGCLESTVPCREHRELCSLVSAKTGNITKLASNVMFIVSVQMYTIGLYKQPEISFPKVKTMLGNLSTPSIQSKYDLIWLHLKLLDTMPTNTLFLWVQKGLQYYRAHSQKYFFGLILVKKNGSSSCLVTPCPWFYCHVLFLH